MVRVEKRCKGADPINPPGYPTAHKCGHCCIGKDQSNAMIFKIAHVHIPTHIYSHACWLIKFYPNSTYTIGKTRHRTRQGGDQAQRGNLPDFVVKLIRHKYKPIRVHCEPRGCVEARKGTLAISHWYHAASPCNRGGHPRGRDPSYFMCICITDVNDIRARVCSYTPRGSKARGNPCTVHSPIGPASSKCACYPRDYNYCSDAIVLLVCHVHHKGVSSHSCWVVKGSCCTLTIGKPRRSISS